MGKTIGFVETASKKVIQGDKTSVTVKNGNLTVWKEFGSIIVRHFSHVILEIDLSKGEITRWHIQSQTDANYIHTIMENLWYHKSFRTGYRPVNGGGYFEQKIGDEWVPVGGEY